MQRPWPLLLATVRAFTVWALLSSALAFGADEAELKRLLDGIQADKYPEAASVVALDETRVEVEESGLSHVYRTRVVKVLTEAGAAELSTLRFDYDPVTSLAEVKGLTLYRQGQAPEPVAASRVYDLPQPMDMIYWGPRMKVASIPRLNPGDAVRIDTYSKGFVIAYLAESDEKYIPPMRGHYYDVVLFQGEQPIVRKSYQIRLPKDKHLRAEVFNGELKSRMSYDETSTEFTWWKENVPAIKRERLMVEDTDVMPKLVLATVKDWPEKSRWFYRVNEDAKVFDATADIKAKVAEVTRGLKTDAEKRKALLAWVARQIRYSGISMGPGEGYTLHPGEMTFNDRAGVCKDIAGMLITMFRAAGYKTYPAMTMAGARVEDLPADQFNHCVVAVEVGKGQFEMYDPTWCPFSAEVWSSAERPQHYVIGSPEGDILRQMAEANPAENQLKAVSRGRISPDGTLEAELTLSGSGYAETSLRWAVVNSPAVGLRPSLEAALVDVAPRAELLSYSHSDPVDVDTSFTLKVKYRVPGYAVVGDRVLLLSPSAGRGLLGQRRLTGFLAFLATPTRTHDIFLPSNREVVVDEQLTLPGGYRLAQPVELAKVDGPAASFEGSVEAQGKILSIRERLVVKRKIIPATEQPNLKQAWDAYVGLRDGLLELRQEDKR